MTAPREQKALLTIGYEGLDIDRFVKCLVANRVDVLVDVREIVEEHSRVCLMCFEREHEKCHRSSLADRTARAFDGKLPVEPVNTFVK